MERGRHLRAALGAPRAAPSGREILGWLGLGILLAVVVTWPLVAHLGQRVPQDVGDPLGQAWALAWGGHAVRADPTALFHANTFWPTGPSLAYSDSLLGYLPFGLFGDGVTAAVTRYDLVFLLAYGLAFAGAATLARELGCSRPAALVAGVAFAFAPWRAAHNGHLNVLSSGGIPLALALLVGGYRRRRPGRVLAGWAVATWQLTIGFALGIYFFYLLATLGVLAVATWLWRGRPPPGRGVVLATLAGAVVFAGVTAAMVSPYRQVVRTYPEAQRDRLTVEFYSPSPSGLFAAPAENRMWGEATRQARETLRWPPEQALFPGLAIVVLAVVGTASGRLPRGVRAGLATGVVASTVLSFGLSYDHGRSAYGVLYDLLPGLDGLRTPGRLTTVSSLGLAVLGALGADVVRRLLDGAPAETGRYRQSAALSRRSKATAGALLLGAVVLLEGLPKLPLVDVPDSPDLTGVADPQYHLPAGPFPDTRHMLGSVDGFPRIGNGYSGVAPAVLERLREQARGFPDPASVTALRALGFRTVVLHLDMAAGTEWQATATRPVDGLGISRTRRGRVLVYDLIPD